MTVGEGQGRALLLALGAVESSLPQLVNADWQRYALQRFAIPSAKERNSRLELDCRVDVSWRRMREQARRQQQPLGFTSLRLKFFCVKSLEYACPFCGEAYGVMSLGIVWDSEPSIVMAEPYALLNVVVCCELCGRGKGTLSGSAWLDVMQALRAADDSAARAAREAIAAGREVVDGRKGQRYFPGGTARG